MWLAAAAVVDAEEICRRDVGLDLGLVDRGAPVFRSHEEPTAALQAV